jgi:hypothetical protein
LLWLLQHFSFFSIDFEWLRWKVAQNLTQIYHAQGEVLRDYLRDGLDPIDRDYLERTILSYDTSAQYESAETDQQKTSHRDKAPLLASQVMAPLTLDFTKAFSE